MKENRQYIFCQPGWDNVKTTINWYDIGEFENIHDEFDKIKMIKQIKMEELDDMKDDLKKVKEEMKNIDLNIEILNTNDEL